MCEEIRKSTPGCLDCPQSLSFFCEEAHKFRAVKAWQHMNETWFEYLEEQNRSKDFRAEINGNLSLVHQREKEYLELLTPEFVNLESAWLITTQSDEYRRVESRIDQANATLQWQEGEIRSPVFKNFTAVKKDLEKLESKFNSASSARNESERKLVKEKERKVFLIDRISNYSREIVETKLEIDTRLHDFVLAQLYWEANVSFAQYLSANDSVAIAQRAVGGLKQEIAEFESMLRKKNDESGATQLSVKLDKTKASLKSVLNELGQVQLKRDEMMAFKADCDAATKSSAVMINETLIAHLRSRQSEMSEELTSARGQDQVANCNELRLRTDKMPINSVMFSELKHVEKITREELLQVKRRITEFRRGVTRLITRSFTTKPVPWWGWISDAIYALLWGDIRKHEQSSVESGEFEAVSADMANIARRLSALKQLKSEIHLAGEKFQDTYQFFELACGSILAAEARMEWVRAALILVEIELDGGEKELAKFREKEKRCKLFSVKELNKHQRNYDRIQSVVNRLNEEIRNLSVEIAKFSCSECDSMREQAIQIELQRDKAEERLQMALKRQELHAVEFKKAYDRINISHKRKHDLKKTFREIEENRPKLEAELSVKDELVGNITRKKEELSETMIGLEPLIVRQRTNFTIWNESLSAIDADIALVNNSLHEHMKAAVQLPRALHNLRDQFGNISSVLNETFYNLTWAQESLENSTSKTKTLVDKFKQTESFYLLKDAELKEYTIQVEQGLIDKVDFKFLY
jgi:chromosome segregation ATPase